MSKHRFRWAAGLAVVLTMVVSSQALAAITWAPAGGTGRVGTNFTWNNGDPTLVQPGDGSLVAAYVTDTIKGVFAQDGTGPFMGNYVVRSTDGGASWSKPQRINGQFHADRVTLTATGSNVVAFFMDQTMYYSGGAATFDPAAKRFVYARRNTANGAAGSWQAAVKLPGQTNASRGDYLYSASSGSNVYVVTTNTQTGQIWLWRSTNSGATFTGPVVVGTTTAVDNVTGYVGGFSGLPAVAATGDDVGVIWTSTAAGEMKVAISSNAGASFGAATVLEASGSNANNGYAQATGRDSRLAFTWTTAAGGFLRIYDTATDSFQAKRTFVTFPDADPAVGNTWDKGGEGALVALDAGNTVGISLTECSQTAKGICNNAALSDSNARSQLVYRESSDNGANWSAASIIAAPTGTKGTQQNNYGSTTFVGGDPYVVYSAHNTAYTAYTNQLRVGTGTP